jgi:acetoacetyl-CoA reductase
MERVALVTGGTRGIGAEISRALKATGHKVVASYAGNDAAAKAFAGETGIAVLRFDAGDYGACEVAVAEIAKTHGPIEILVNNAGITRDTTLARMTREMWDAVINTNLGSCFNLCKLTFEGMRARKFGRVVNISSINGQAGQYGQVNYAAAKGALNAATKSLALELATRGITVNAVAPGIIATPMSAGLFGPEALKRLVPLGRAGTPEEVASLVAFLASDEAAYITAQILSVDGGMA